MRSIALATAALAAGSFLAGPARGKGAQQPPNIVLIVLDDLGFEKLDWWPFQPFPAGVMMNPPTPSLQRLAQEGVVFTNAWASPICSPSRMQILTGRHSHRTGVGTAIGPETAYPVQNDAELLLPEVIQGAATGYRTGAFGKWHVVPELESCHPTMNGFEVFQGHMINVMGSVFDAMNMPSGHHFHWNKIDSMSPLGCSQPTLVGSPMSNAPADWCSTVARQDALNWIASLPPEDPFFAYVAFQAPHEPLQVPPFGLLSSNTVTHITNLPDNPATMQPYAPGDSPGTVPTRICGTPSYPELFGRHVEVLNWMIEAVDTEIGIIRGTLRALGRLANTVIIIVGDNRTSRRAVDCPLNAEHAKTSIYQLGSRVPLIVWGPSVIAPQDQGTVRSDLISLVDLWPTTAEIAGVVDPAGQLPMNRTPDGRSFRHLIDSSVLPPPLEERRDTALVEIFTEFSRHHIDPAPRFQRAVVHESGLKYTHQRWVVPPPVGNDAEEFLDLTADPDELDNLAYFQAFTNGDSPCELPACPTFGPPPHKCSALPGLQALGCAPAHPSCPFALLGSMFASFYEPLFCAATASN